MMQRREKSAMDINQHVLIPLAVVLQLADGFVCMPHFIRIWQWWYIEYGGGRLD
jgi:hypothetical protein